MPRHPVVGTGEECPRSSSAVDISSVLSAHISSTLPPRARLSATVIVAACLLVGCGAANADRDPTAQPEPTAAIAPGRPAATEATATPTTPAGASTPEPAFTPAPNDGPRPVGSTSPPPTEGAVLAAHDAYLHAFHESMVPPDPDHPGLTAWATGPQLDTAIRIRTTQVERNWLAEGTYGSSPTVATMSEVEATVVDCYFEDIVVRDARGLEVRRTDPAPYVLESVLVPEDGVWKVSLFLSEGTPCSVD